MSDDEGASPPHYLDTVEGEISLFKAIAQARPVGANKHFHMIAMVQAIKQESGRLISPDDIWEKLRSLYNLELLDEEVSTAFCQSAPELI